MNPFSVIQMTFYGQDGIRDAGEAGASILDRIVRDLFPLGTAFAGPLFDLVQAVLVITSLILCARAIMKLYETGQSSSAAQVRGDKAMIAAYFITAVLLASIGDVAQALNGTVFESNNILAYERSIVATQSGLSPQARLALRNVLLLVQFLGFLWLISSVIKIPALSRGNDPKATAGKVFIRFFASIFLLNIYQTLEIIDYYFS